MKHFFAFILLFALLVQGCKEIPEGVVPPEQMTQVLIDVHLAEAVIEQYPSNFRKIETKQELMHGVFEKNNITKADFDSSLVYYSRNLGQYMKIYEDVAEQLTIQADTAKQHLLAYERSLLSPVGDSVDVWKQENQLILTSQLGQFASFFELKGDSNYLQEDVMEWQMNVINIDSVQPLYFSFVYQEAGKPGVYHDTVLYAPTQYVHRFDIHQMGMGDKFYGSFNVLNAQDTSRSVVRVFIDDIALMRYHKEEEVPSDTITVNP